MIQIREFTSYNRTEQNTLYVLNVSNMMSMLTEVISTSTINRLDSYYFMSMGTLTLLTHLLIA